MSLLVVSSYLQTDFTKYANFSLDNGSDKLFARPNQILPDQKYGNIKQQQVTNSSFQDFV